MEFCKSLDTRLEWADYFRILDWHPRSSLTIAFLFAIDGQALISVRDLSLRFNFSGAGELFDIVSFVGWLGVWILWRPCAMHGVGGENTCGYWECWADLILSSDYTYYFLIYRIREACSHQIWGIL